MVADKSQIFSHEALDKLRSPEKLDAMLVIATPITWMALVAILALIIFSRPVVDLRRLHHQGGRHAGVMNISHAVSDKISPSTMAI